MCNLDLFPAFASYPDIAYYCRINQIEYERKKKLAELEAAQKLAAELKGKEVTINAKAGDNGRLFGAITNKDVNNPANAICLVVFICKNLLNKAL